MDMEPEDSPKQMLSRDESEKVVMRVYDLLGSISSLTSCLFNRVSSRRALREGMLQLRVHRWQCDLLQWPNDGVYRVERIHLTLDYGNAGAVKCRNPMGIFHSLCKASGLTTIHKRAFQTA